MPRNTLGDMFQPSDTICKYRSLQTSKHAGVLQNNQRLYFLPVNLAKSCDI